MTDTQIDEPAEAGNTPEFDNETTRAQARLHVTIALPQLRGYEP